MKKLIFVLLAGSVALTSCNKEKSLGNRLEDKWDITEWNSDVTGETVEYKTDGTIDTTYNPYAPNANYSVTSVTTGTVDFVSDDNVIIETKTVTTTSVKTASGTTTSTSESENKMSQEYFATGEDEVTLIDNAGGYTVYEVTTNEKDAQTWTNVDTDIDEDFYGNGTLEKKETKTTTTTLSLTKIED